MNPIQIFFAAASVISTTLSGAFAEDLAAPSGQVLLSVSGAISVTNDGDTARFDMEMLRDLGETSFTTITPWTEGQQTFTGVSLKALLDRLEVDSGTLSATAVNDYAVDIPAADAVEDGPIVAYMRNGETMSVRDKGPLWVVYPYDAKEEYQAEVIFSRSIWQLDRIVISE
jgi:hypothetical protein